MSCTAALDDGSEPQGVGLRMQRVSLVRFHDIDNLHSIRTQDIRWSMMEMERSAAEVRVVRKIDLLLMPLLTVTLGLQVRLIVPLRLYIHGPILSSANTPFLLSSIMTRLCWGMLLCLGS